MNIFKVKYLLIKKAIEERKKIMAEKHLTKAYYRTLDIAIERCKQQPRKYYIVQKSAAEWEILGSQEIRKMRKFKEARQDENFMKLHEMAPYVDPINLQRHIHEQTRRKNKWWFLYSENYYKPVTKSEMELLKRVLLQLKLNESAAADDFETFIQKHL